MRRLITEISVSRVNNLGEDNEFDPIHFIYATLLIVIETRVRERRRLLVDRVYIIMHVLKFIRDIKLAIVHYHRHLSKIHLVRDARYYTREIALRIQRFNDKMIKNASSA